MFNRAKFWSPVPDWSRVSLGNHGIHIEPVAAASVWLVSGNLQAFGTRHGLSESLGPRQSCTASRYALRLGPDRLLLVSEEAATDSFGWSPDGSVITDISDGMVIFDISGEATAALLMQGSEYPFTTAPVLAQESARMRFAGFNVIVARRAQGWRLHIERHWGPALWRWLLAHVEEEC